MKRLGWGRGAGQQGQRLRREHKGQGGARSRMGGERGETTLSRKKEPDPLVAQAGLWGRCGCKGGKWTAFWLTRSRKKHPEEGSRSHTTVYP